MENFGEMDMPTPCESCGDWFDLNDGYGSDKWHPDIVICVKCHGLEVVEIEEDERWEEINIDLSNALHGLDKEQNINKRLDTSNKDLILSVSKLLKTEDELIIESYKSKADKWDKLDEQIAKFYPEDGSLEDEMENDGLIGIGEAAARAFKYL